MVNLMNVCSKGHDLTLPDARIVQSNGNRACRECIVQERSKKATASSRRIYGAFED